MSLLNFDNDIANGSDDVIAIDTPFDADEPASTRNGGESRPKSTPLVLIKDRCQLQIALKGSRRATSKAHHLVLRKQDNQRTVIQIARVRGFPSAFVLYTESRAPVEKSREIIGKKVQFTLLTWCEDLLLTVERLSDPRFWRGAIPT
jgi:hypothetical protein